MSTQGTAELFPVRYKDFDFDYVRQLAEQNGYTYTEKETSQDEESIYANTYTSTTKFQKLSFMVDEYPVEMYTALYTPMIIKKQASYLTAALSEEALDSPVGQAQVQVFSVTLPFQVEDLYVESRTNISLNNILGLSSVIFRDTKTVTLEGDFNNFYRVYAPENEEINAFTILAPNIMLRMLRDAGNYDFEFSGNKIYFYKTFSYTTPGYVNLSRSDFENLLAFGTAAAKVMVRAGRPARVTEAGNVKMWQLYGAKNSVSFLRLFLATFFGMFFVFLCFIVPLLWPLALIFVLWYIIKFRRIQTKRRQLLEKYNA